ncbi:MAG: hypothetical protein LBC44_02145 [Mycoplasmataceae bacterium]|nr:hypothetical protein [Mycoplasmataceae bacterium]
MSKDFTVEQQKKYLQNLQRCRVAAKILVRIETYLNVALFLFFLLVGLVAVVVPDKIIEGSETSVSPFKESDKPLVVGIGAFFVVYSIMIVVYAITIDVLYTTKVNSRSFEPHVALAVFSLFSIFFCGLLKLVAGLLLLSSGVRDFEFKDEEKEKPIKITLS